MPKISRHIKGICFFVSGIFLSSLKAGEPIFFLSMIPWQLYLFNNHYTQIVPNPDGIKYQITNTKLQKANAKNQLVPERSGAEDSNNKCQ